MNDAMHLVTHNSLVIGAVETRVPSYLFEACEILPGNTLLNC